MELETIERPTYAPRTVECSTCEGRGQHNEFVRYAGEAYAGEPVSSYCSDCDGEGTMPASCDCCDKEVPLADNDCCASCNGEA